MGANVLPASIGGAKMRRCLWLLSVCLAAALTAGPAGAADLGFTFAIGPSLPIGNFGEKTDIIEVGDQGEYSATGGGAETGLGFNIELEIKVTPRISIGGVFGYRRYNADASDILEKLVKPAIPAVRGIDAKWTATLLGGLVRVSAFESEAWRVYAKAGLGSAKLTNAFDVTFDVPGSESMTVTSDFDLGNKFYLDGAVGMEYKLRDNILLVGEVGLCDFFFDGTEATATAGEYELTGTQKFDAQVFNAMLGIRVLFGTTLTAR
jgi:hypothetical protein